MALSCLNENPNHPLAHALDPQDPDSFLESDTDHQLLLHIPFDKRVAIKEVKISTKGGDSETAPALVKFFVNNAALDFGDAESAPPILVTHLAKDSAENNCVQIPSGPAGLKFKDVESLQIFVEENHGAEVTRIHTLDIVGVPAESGNNSRLDEGGFGLPIPEGWKLAVQPE